MTVQLLSAETEEITDSTSFSVVAFVGLILSLIGIFSLQYIHVMPLSILGGALGAFALLIANRSKLGIMSKIFAVLATTIGVTIASWGLFHRSLESDFELSQARKISEMYLNYLSNNDEQHVMYLIGFQLEAAETPLDEQESPTKRAMKRFQNDPVHKEIRERKTPPKWTYVGFEGESPGSKGHSYKLTYRDDSMTNPPHYWIFARKNAAKYDRRENVHWFVDNLELARKL